MHQRGVWISGALMGALGLAIGLRAAGARLAELAARAAGFAGGPTPRSLDWIEETAPARHLLTALDRWLALAAGILAIACAWRMARLLNPHGTVFAPGTGGDGRRLQAPLEPSLAWRAFGAALATLYLLGGLGSFVGEVSPAAPPWTWGLPGLVFLWPGHPWVGAAAAFLVGGALLWLLWGEWGAVTPRSVPSSSRSGTLLRGLLAGAAALPVLLPLSPGGRSLLDGVLAAVGLGQPAPWRLALWSMALGLPAAFFALGFLGHALARPGAATPFRMAVPALLLALVGAGEAYLAAAAVERFDVGRDLAARVGAARQPSSARAYLIFPPPPLPGPMAGFVPWMSISRIDAGNGSPERTWEYLRRRDYQVASAWDAFVHLHDCASLGWDSAESLRVDLANLAHHPQPVFSGLLVEKLSTCATSPENRALLRQAADTARFRPTPAWLRTLGLLHLRFGDRAAAARLLRQAGLGEEEVRQALGRETPLTSGTVTGRIVVDGRPGAGLSAGLLPAAQWRSLVGTPRPFELRWVGAAAATDADGRFRLNHLGAGTYLFIVMGDPDHLPLRGAGAAAGGRPGPILLDAAHPARDLGTIEIDTRGVPGPLEAPAPPGASTGETS